MLSMLDIYKKYSLSYNNLEVFCIGYGIRKGLATQKQVPSTSILNFIRKPFFIYPCCFKQFLYDDIYISIYIKL